MATDEIGKVGGIVATVVVFVMLMIVLAVLAMVCVNALAASPWGVFSVGCTIPIAVCMGLWLRFVQPGRITQVSIVGFAILIGVIIGGRWVAESSFGHYLPAITETLPVMYQEEGLGQDNKELVLSEIRKQGKQFYEQWSNI